MKYYRTSPEGDTGKQHLVVEHDDFYDLTAAYPGLDSFRALARRSRADESVDEVTKRLLTDAEVCTGDLNPFDRPVVPDEVWGAGGTYDVVSELDDSVDLFSAMQEVDQTNRPEIFLKTTACRVGGPNEAIGARTDSDWTHPEPELGVVLYDGEIVGYSIGNDVSATDLMMQNLLYYPQAKTFERCCALGPCIVSPETFGDPMSRRITMRVERNDEIVYEGETSTARMTRSITELVEQLRDHNTVPELTVLLTGTELGNDSELSLCSEDRVSIQIENIGELSNPVVEV